MQFELIEEDNETEAADDAVLMGSDVEALISGFEKFEKNHALVDYSVSGLFSKDNHQGFMCDNCNKTYTLNIRIDPRGTIFV